VGGKLSQDSELVYCDFDGDGAEFTIEKSSNTAGSWNLSVSNKYICFDEFSTVPKVTEKKSTLCDFTITPLYDKDWYKK
jgi:hypothetical protein